MASFGETPRCVGLWVLRARVAPDTYLTPPLGYIEQLSAWNLLIKSDLREYQPFTCYTHEQREEHANLACPREHFGIYEFGNFASEVRKLKEKKKIKRSEEKI